jgi:histidyl-tRNA synthetase
MSNPDPSPNSRIEPKILKGFRDLLPDQELVRRQLISKLEAVMAIHGFVPIDTPALEYTEVLLGKGGGETDKQVYRFKDGGERDVAMRFDLTVPFARFMAAHRAELYLPFKRFHFAKVWRGENSQRGRYREFMQCDFDLVGADSAGADLEILLVMNRAFAAIGVSQIRFHLNHRGIFNRFLERLGIANQSVEILRRVDKLLKIGPAATHDLLVELMASPTADTVLDFIQARGGHQAVLHQLETLAGGPGPDTERLRQLLTLAKDLGLAERIILDPSITRGLDYYTGLVFETFLTDLPSIGSVCSGGRYNNLAGLYTAEALPGVGGSIGLDRLLAGLAELGKVETAPLTTTLLVFCQDEAYLADYHRLAETVRASGIAAEVYPVAKKLPIQFSYAEKKRIKYGLLCGPAELAASTVNLKDLQTRETVSDLSLAQAIARIKLTVQP